MASNNAHTPVLSGPVDRGAQVIGSDDYLRLCRIADAAALLAKLPSEAAKMLEIEADHTSAVAQYMAEDLAAILSRSRPADE